jgi:hypothetical protein
VIPGKQAPQCDEGVADEAGGGGVAGHFEPFIAGGATRDDACEAEGDAEVPNLRTNGDEQALSEGDASAAGHDPEAGGEEGVDAEAVGEGIQSGGLDASVGEPRAVGKEFGIEELVGGEGGEGAACEEPHARGGEHEREGQAAGIINGLRRGQFTGGSGGFLVGSAGEGVAHSRGVHSNALGATGAGAVALSTRARRSLRAAAGSL